MSAQGIPTPQWAPVGGQWSVGLDVGGTKVLGVLLDAEGAVRHQLRSATVAGAAGVEDTAAVNTCIDDQSFVSWVRAATERATSGPLPGTEVASVSGTPTVLVNGEAYTGSLTDADAFSSFVLSAAADTYSSATPTPTPAAG